MPSKPIYLTAARSADTQALGVALGHWASAGTVITLTGDLGSGKTTFVQGLAQGLQVPADVYVTSPSYTLINEYPGRLRLYHIDLYRLNDPVEFEDIGLADILSGDGVAAIEWAERLPKDWLTVYVHLHFTVTGDTSRRIVLTAYGQDGHILIKQIEKFIEECR